ncbi:hypothetical protein BJV74DRAFT_256116 [Russula compacta]|nr:hypothetical protein BJV74DRAFT_256116 [Russula compacta]
MSQTFPPTPSSSSYQSIFDCALESYGKKTQTNLLSHPLLAKLETSHSPDAILTALREQIPGFDQSRSRDEKLTRWLDSTVNVISSFSATIGGGISLAYPPAGVIFTGIGVLLSAATAVSSTRDTLIDVFERIENFFRRLEVYIDVPPTVGMIDIIVKIMCEVLSVLAIATKEIKQGKAKAFLNRLIGRTDIEDALRRLDKLTQDEVRMAAAQGLKATHRVNDRMKGIDVKIDSIIDGGRQISEEEQRNQLRQNLAKWLSPADPSINYNTATNAHHGNTALWFIQSDTFNNWKQSSSLLWIYGKPGSGKTVLTSAIIQHISCICGAGSGHIAFFFFDFKDTGKQDPRALLSSLIVQLNNQSNSQSFYDILFAFHSAHQGGTQQPSIGALTNCLENMLRVVGDAPIYLIVDALDECPNTAGIPSSRDQVLDLVEKLVKLNIPNLRLCVTSRPEIDIRASLEPLTSRTNRMSLHDEGGQKNDIIDFVSSVVHSDKKMRRWRDEDKKLVIETLSERADGIDSSPLSSTKRSGYSHGITGNIR